MEERAMDMGRLATRVAIIAGQNGSAILASGSDQLMLVFASTAGWRVYWQRA
jgi:hypothetical protein